MIKFFLIHSRRHLFKLGTGALVTLLSALNSGCDIFEKENLPIEQRLIRLLNHLQRAQEIGNAYISQNDAIKSYSPEQLTNMILNWMNIDVTEAQELSDKKITQLFRQQIRDDFAQENVVIIGQWMFSKTELLLCALAASYPNT